MPRLISRIFIALALLSALIAAQGCSREQGQDPTRDHSLTRLDSHDIDAMRERAAKSQDPNRALLEALFGAGYRPRAWGSNIAYFNRCAVGPTPDYCIERPTLDQPLVTIPLTKTPKRVGTLNRHWYMELSSTDVEVSSQDPYFQDPGRHPAPRGYRCLIPQTVLTSSVLKALPGAIKRYQASLRFREHNPYADRSSWRYTARTDFRLAFFGGPTITCQWIVPKRTN
jgi:hypothetical protein